jgi:hypothetical protein
MIDTIGILIDLNFGRRICRGQYAARPADYVDQLGQAAADVNRNAIKAVEAPQPLHESVEPFPPYDFDWELVDDGHDGRDGPSDVKDQALDHMQGIDSAHHFRCRNGGTDGEVE